MLLLQKEVSQAIINSRQQHRIVGSLGWLKSHHQAIGPFLIIVVVKQIDFCHSKDGFGAHGLARLVMFTA